MTNFLSDGNYVPRFKPKQNKKVYKSEHDKQSEESRDEELNNMGRDEVTEDFSDSNFADRV